MVRKAVLASLCCALALSVAAPVFAQEATPTPAPNPSPSPTVKPKPAYDGACMQAAVDKRDTAIIAAFDKYAASVKSALETRRSALKDAWGKPTPKERRAAIKAAWAAYRKSVRGARQQLNKDKRAVWKQFRLDAKACRPASADLGTESGGEGADQSL